MISRPSRFSSAFTTSVPRTAVGVNEYLYALSLRDHGAVRCGLPPILALFILVGLLTHLIPTEAPRRHIVRGRSILLRV